MNAVTDFSKGADRPVIDEEVPFEPSELFFSRTDERGIILTANEVFQRVARHPWETLLGAPHRIVRHPDMPRAVFWLLWSRMKAGEPVAGYVKNRAADGRYYWVLAVATAIKGGYLSVRLKPTAGLRPEVEKIYAEVRALELNENMAPEDSGAILLERITGLGYRDYTHFMSHALAEEYLSRDTLTGPSDCASIRNFRTLIDLSRRIPEEVAKIPVIAEKNRFVAFNMRVRAARMGAGSKAVGVISDEYGIHSRDMLDALGGFTDRAHRLSERIAKGSFLIAAGMVQRDVIEQFARETDLPQEIDAGTERVFLNDQRAEHNAQELDNIATEARRFSARIEHMRRLISGLEVTRIMGMVECAHLGARGKGLVDVLNDLDAFQRDVSDVIGRIDDLNQALCRTIRQMH